MRSVYMKVLGFVLSALASVGLANFGLRGVNSQSDVAVAGGICLIVGLVLLWTWIIVRICRSVDLGKYMPRVVVLALAASWLSGCTTINPGHVGIQVNKLGADRGVESYPKVTGLTFYNPLTTSIFEYPTFVQTAVWTKDAKEGSPNDESISFNSKEGLIIGGDISLSYQLQAEKVPSFYVKFRSDDLELFTHGFLRNVARDAFNELAATFNVEELYGAKKEEFLVAVRARVNSQVSPFGVELQQLGFIGAPRLPNAVTEQLNAKIAATQAAITSENQLRTAEAEAKKRVAAAEGEAKSNQILTQSLSPTLLQWRSLEIQEKSVQKWNGVLPTYSGSGAVPFIQLGK